MNLLNALAKVSSLTMVSRILGFIRDMIIARVFGASAATDAFFVAFKLPNMLRRIFAEGAFSQAFVPILAEYRQTRSPEATRDFVQHVAGMLTFALTVVTAIGVLAAPWIIYATATGFAKTPEKAMLASDLLRVMAPYILFISLSSFVGSILNTYHKFSIPAFTPTLLNISFIVFSLFFVPYFDPPIMALAWAVFVGGLLQLGFQLPWLAKQGFLKMPKLDFKNAAVIRVITKMGPAIFAASVTQISLIISTIFASFLQTGSVTWMYYADRLTELPTGVLGVALGTILLPTLSKHAGGRNPKEFSKLLDWGLRLCFLLSAPAALALTVLAFPLISTLFMSKGFTVYDVTMTQKALMAYSFCVVGQIMVKVLAPAFYAQQNIKTPVKIALFTLVVTQLMNLAFVGPLQHVGLSLAVGLGACLNAGLLFVLLRVKDIYQPAKGWASFLLKLTTALLVMGAGLWAAMNYLPMDWVNAGSGRKALQLLGLIVLGVALYFSTLGLLGFRPRDFKRSELQ
ncbi:murein biosynthesis integral membrane protein MurJ [Neisseria canis]|uniref:Probable lipid II flippase MurJ n=1 Tax=Neisseria canis TaxID=493 RepID=A0A448D671_9NEIS|nr:murein biosynthesis integral membrane protein MurJ [Neisseria canis]OSI11390.1 murein biosynthesis integral membrane protein MurJ [Neisseria canis]VEE99818.1 virulence factor MviN [Neisseria canis]